MEMRLHIAKLALIPRPDRRRRMEWADARPLLVGLSFCNLCCCVATLTLEVSTKLGATAGSV